MADNNTDDRDDPSEDDDLQTSTDGGSGADKTIMVEMTQEEYDSLSKTKQANGFTWKGMLMHAQRSLESCK